MIGKHHIPNVEHPDVVRPARRKSTMKYRTLVCSSRVAISPSSSVRWTNVWQWGSCSPTAQENVAKLYRKFRGPLMLKYLKELAANDQAMASAHGVQLALALLRSVVGA